MSGAASLLIAGGLNKSQVAFGAAGTGAIENAGIGYVDVPYPTGIVAGSFLVLHVINKDSSTPGITTPAGWSSIHGVASTTVAIAAFYKIATGSESGSVAVTYANAAHLYAIGRMYRFSKATGVVSASSLISTSSDVAISNLNVTTTKVKSAAVQLMSFDGAGTTLADSTGESGADYAQPIAVYSPGQGNIGIQYAAVPTPTAISGGSAALGASRAQRGTVGFSIYP